MKRFIFLFFIFALFACKNNTDQTDNSQNNNIEDTTSLIDDYAKFISGIKTKEFEEIQNKDFYKNYANAIGTSWNYFYINQLTLISKWCINKNIISNNDTIPLFYPFSGPDFPFAEAFFPYAKNYLFIGLENTGRIPDFKTYTDLQIEKYLYNFSNSMAEYFQNGYFSTKNMKNNFRNPEMNGIVHPLIFFITRTGNHITDLKYIVIDKYGQAVEVKQFQPLEKRIKGIKITFDGKYGKKRLYYLQVDLSNANFPAHNELTTFICNFKEKNVFVKSASYLLQRDDFSIFRNFLFDQAVKILQDDSGFSYKFLKSHNTNIKLFGKYNHTLKIFKDYEQKDLQEAFNKLQTEKLPFRFGYNIPFEETALIYATKEKPEKEVYPYYLVQFEIKWDKQKTDTFPSYLQPVTFYFDGGYYKYISGHFTNLEKAKNFLNKVKEQYPDAFIIEIKNFSKKIING